MSHPIFLTALNQEVDIVNGLRLWSGRLYYKAVQSDDTAFQGKRSDEKG